MNKYLLDTQVIIWIAEANPLLSKTAENIILDPDSILYISTASIWEMAIKISIGKLKIPSPLNVLIDRQLKINQINELTINKEHSSAVLHLPFYHRDPFDRLLICQAQIEGLPLISSDKNFSKYSIKRVW